MNRTVNPREPDGSSALEAKKSATRFRMALKMAAPNRT
jgi:hypothetical protein